MSVNSQFSDINCKIYSANCQIKAAQVEEAKKAREAEEFDKIGDIAVEKGCLKIQDNKHEINSLKNKKYNIVDPLLGGMGLLGVSATIAIIAATIIVTNPIVDVVFATLFLGSLIFFPAFLGGTGLTIEGLIEFGEKHLTQGRIIELHDEIDTAKDHLNVNSEKIRNWIEVQTTEINEKLDAFREGKIKKIDTKKLSERLSLCLNLSAVLPKKAPAVA